MHVPRGNATAIQLDAQGHGASDPIQSAPVTFTVQSNTGHWAWSPPGSWTVASNQTLQVQWDVALAPGTLQIVDEVSGQPLAGKPVMIGADSGDGVGSFGVASDEQGKLALQLVPGAYQLQLQFERVADGKIIPSTYEPARFEWTANGPVNAVLEIAKKP